MAWMLASVTQSGLPSGSKRPPPLLTIIATIVCAPRLLSAPDPVAKPDTPIFFRALPAASSSSQVVGTLTPAWSSSALLYQKGRTSVCHGTAT